MQINVKFRQKVADYIWNAFICCKDAYKGYTYITNESKSTDKYLQIQIKVVAFKSNKNRL